MKSWRAGCLHQACFVRCARATLNKQSRITEITANKRVTGKNGASSPKNPLLLVFNIRLEFDFMCFRGVKCNRSCKYYNIVLLAQGTRSLIPCKWQGAGWSSAPGTWTLPGQATYSNVHRLAWMDWSQMGFRYFLWLNLALTKLFWTLCYILWSNTHLHV